MTENPDDRLNHLGRVCDSGRRGRRRCRHRCKWQCFEQYQHEPSIAVVRFLLAYSGEAEKHADRIREQTVNGYAALDAMERHLAGRTFLVGDRYSIADISLYAYTHVAHEGGFDLGSYPAIRALARAGGGPAGARHDRRLTRRF